MAWVYILSIDRRTVLYIGATVNISRRMWQHATKQYPKAFTAKYNVSRLVYFESFPFYKEALDREKVLKRKPRKWKE